MLEADAAKSLMPTFTSAAAAGALVDTPETVVREPRFRGVDWVLFGVLSMASAGAIAAFFAYVIQHADRSWSFWIAVVVIGCWLLLWEAKWLALPHMARPRWLPPPSGLRVAAVTTFVPSGEPLSMLESTVEALLNMRTPHDTWVLDEEGAQEVRALCERLGANYFCRAELTAYDGREAGFAPRTKHGNYNVWLEEVGFHGYDILAAFDPDQVPHVDYLERLLGYFRDPGVAYVQSAPGHYNQYMGFVARAAAEDVYQHGASVLSASYGAGYAPVIGSHNLQRIAALRQLGGLPAHDGEDIVTANLYRLHGWDGVYVPEHLALGLAPADWRAYLKQQRRWARAHVDIKFRVLPRLLAGLPWLHRFGAYLHGLHFLSSALVPIALGVVTLWLQAGRAPIDLGDGWPFVAALLVALGLCEFFRQRYAISRDERGLLWRAGVARVAKSPYVLLGIVDGLRRVRTAYVLTNKTGEIPSERLLPGLAGVALAVVGGAWAYGAMAGGGIDDSGLHVLGAAAIAPLLAILTTFGARPRPAYAPMLPERAPQRLAAQVGTVAGRGDRAWRDGESPRRGRRVHCRGRLLTAKVVQVDIDKPFRPLHVEPRYAQVLVIVLRRGRVVGHVVLPALSVVPVDLQQAAIASELGETLWRNELREAVTSAAAAGGASRPGGIRRVSVVICTRDRPGQLRCCVESLLRLRTPPFEIVVVDNAPSDDRTRRTCEEYPVRYVREPSPGQSRARNRGILESTGELVAFTDDDCVVDAGWLDEIEDAFADPLVMAATGYVGPLELETAAQYLFEAQGGFHRGFERVVYDGLAQSPVTAATPAGAGANVVFRRRLFDEIGPFAEDLGPGTPARAADETYAFYRTLAAGYRIVFDPRRIVWHRHRTTARALRTLLFDYGVSTMAFATRCLLRHREPAAPALFAWWLFRRLPTQIGRILARDDRRLPLQFLFAEAAGVLLGPWCLLRSRLSRFRTPALELGSYEPICRPAPVVREGAPRVSVVVPSYNRRDGLRALLQGLERQACPPDLFEAVVILDGSTDGSADAVGSLQLPFPVQVITQPNSGAASARNRGALEARNPVLVFLDDDIVPEKEFVWRHAAAHETAHDLVVVGYCPVAISETDLWSQMLRAWWEDHFRRKAELGHLWSYTDFTVGNSSLPRSLYLDAGGLDEGFGAGRREDWEFGVRLAARGTEFRYEPAAVGFHHLDARLSTRLRQLRQEAHGDILFAARHPQVKPRLLVAELAALIGDDDSGVVWAYRHPRAAERLVSAAVPLLGLYEGLRLRSRWRLLLQKLVGLSYLLGVADVLPTPERLLALFTETWSEPAVRMHVSLDRPGPATFPFGGGAVELALELGGRELTRLAALNRNAQWSWDELAERVIEQAAGDARDVALLERLACGLSTDPALPREVAHAL